MSSRAAAATVHEQLAAATPPPVPVFGKPLPPVEPRSRHGSDSAATSRELGGSRGSGSLKRTVSDSEPEDGELHGSGSDMGRRRRGKKKDKRRRSASSSTSGSRGRKRKYSHTSEEDRKVQKRRSSTESSSASSDEAEDGDSASSGSRDRRSKRKKNSKKKGRKSKSTSPAAVKKEGRGKRKSGGLKNLSFEKIVKKMTPKELKSYLREFKRSQEESQAREEEEGISFLILQGIYSRKPYTVTLHKDDFSFILLINIISPFAIHDNFSPALLSSIPLAVN